MRDLVEVWRELLRTQQLVCGRLQVQTPPAGNELQAGRTLHAPLRLVQPWCLKEWREVILCSDYTVAATTKPHCECSWVAAQPTLARGCATWTLFRVEAQHGFRKQGLL